MNRAVISHMDGKEGEYNMIIDGADLQGVLATPGINWKKTFSNHTPKVKSKHISIYNKINKYI